MTKIHFMLAMTGAVLLIPILSFIPVWITAAAAVLAAAAAAGINAARSIDEKKLKEQVEKCRKEMDEALAEGAEIIFPSEEACTAAACMPDGAFKSILLPDRPEICFLKGDPVAISPYGTTETLLSPPEVIMMRRGRDRNRMAKKIIRSTRKKCAGLKDADWIIFCDEGRVMAGIDKKGKFIRVVFDGRIRDLFYDIYFITNLDKGFDRYLDRKIVSPGDLIKRDFERREGTMPVMISSKFQSQDSGEALEKKYEIREKMLQWQ